MVLFTIFREKLRLPYSLQTNVILTENYLLHNLGTTECLIDNLFNKKVNTRVIFNPNTGGIVKIDKD